jgi:hypothetical protein
MEVRQELLNLALCQNVAETRHLGLAHLDNVDHAVVAGLDAAGKLLFLKDVVEAGTLDLSRGIGFVAADAVLIVDAAASRLLLVQAEFGVRLAPLDRASGK